MGKPAKPSKPEGIVGRFAPSPTGRMHLGNIASMLVSWLAAKVRRTVVTGDPALAPGTPEEGPSPEPAPRTREIGWGTGTPGRVVLRIEDIDVPRMVPDADRWIMDDLDWLGLSWDGEPVWQSQRRERYVDAIAGLEGLRLRGTGERLVYPCFCSRREIHAASAPQSSDGFFIYPGTCRRYATTPPSAETLERRHSLRLAMPSGASPAAHVRFVDALYGPQAWDLPKDVGDIVIRRSDGLFAYQLAVVVDDEVQGINQIVRGRDLLRSTAVQMWERRCLLAVREGHESPEDVTAPVSSVPPVPGRVPGAVPSADAPEYLHVPLMLDPNGQRLAKREHSLEIHTLREAGVPADAVIGYVAALLGLTDVSRGTPEQGGMNFEPCTPQDLVRSLEWDTLVSRLRRGQDGAVDGATASATDGAADGGEAGGPRDCRTDPSAVMAMAR